MASQVTATGIELGAGPELDAAGRDADRVVLCRCGGFGRAHHARVDRPGQAPVYVRSGFTCTWDRPGPHGPRLAPSRGHSRG